MINHRISGYPILYRPRLLVLYSFHTHYIRNHGNKSAGIKNQHAATSLARGISSHGRSVQIGDLWLLVKNSLIFFRLKIIYPESCGGFLKFGVPTSMLFSNFSSKPSSFGYLWKPISHGGNPSSHSGGEPGQGLWNGAQGSHRSSLEDPAPSVSLKGTASPQRCRERVVCSW